MVLRALKALVAFRRLGTIVAAAEEVHLSSAAVSAQFKLLEERLGATLFNRTKRSVELSSAGLRLVPLAEKMLQTYEEMQDIGSARPLRGRITLGIINTVLIGIFPAVLQRLNEAYPGLQVKVVSGTSPSLVRQVEAGLLDAAIVNRPPGTLHESLQCRTLFTDRIGLVQASPRRPASVAAAIARHGYIALDRATWVGRAIDQHLALHGTSAEPALELDSQEAVLAAVRFGLGVSVLPLTRGTASTLDTGLHVWRVPGISREITFVEKVTHSHAHLTDGLRATVVQVAEGFATRPGAGASIRMR